MTQEIVNRVASSTLQTINLEDFFPENERVSIDIKEFLSEEGILREKEFRKKLDNFNFFQFTDKFVALNCSVEAILPSWTYFLLASHLQPFAKIITFGNLADLEREIFIQTINSIDWEKYRNQKVIVKGCSHKQIPQSAFVYLIQKLQPLAQSIMFGEACSNVPIFKAKSNLSKN